jgi:hypothetical protein
VGAEVSVAVAVSVAVVVGEAVVVGLAVTVGLGAVVDVVVGVAVPVDVAGVLVPSSPQATNRLAPATMPAVAIAASLRGSTLTVPSGQVL